MGARLVTIEQYLKKRYILALQYSSRKLIIFNVISGTWQMGWIGAAVLVKIVQKKILVSTIKAANVCGQE